MAAPAAPMGTSILFPETAGDLEALAQRQRYADMLRAQAFAPSDPNQVVAGRVVPYSWTQGLARMMDAYTARKLDEQAIADRQRIAMRQANALRSMFGGSPVGAPNYQSAPTGPADSDVGGSGVAPVSDAQRYAQLLTQGPSQGPSPVASSPATSQQQAPQSGGSLAVPGMSPDQAMVASQLAPEAYWAGYMKQFAPADIVAKIRAAGIDPNSPVGQAVAQAALTKDVYTPPTRLGEGAYADPRLGVMGLPAQAPAGSINVRLPDGTWQTQRVPGGLEAAANAAAAVEGAKQGQRIEMIRDASGRMVPVQLGSAISGTSPMPPDVSQTPSQPAPLRNNNPGAMMPGGKLAQYPTPEAGIAAMDQNLAKYGQEGKNTVDAIVRKWVGANNPEENTQKYIQEVAGRLSLKPDQPIDLSNPFVRHAVSAQLMLHENGPTAVFSAKGNPPAAQTAGQAAAPASDQWSDMPKMQQPTGIGQSTFQEGVQKGAGEAVTKLSEKFGSAAENANSRIALNNQALAQVDNATTGRGAASLNEVKNFLTTRVGIPEDTVNKFISGDITATTALQKELVNAATAKAKQQFGARITQSEVQLMLTRGSPSVDMTKEAIKYLLNSDNSAANYAVKQADDFGKYTSMGGDPYRFEAWYARKFPMVISGHPQQPGVNAPRTAAPGAGVKFLGFE